MQWRLLDELHADHEGPNRLPSGDHENLQLMLAAGWQHREYRQPDLRTINKFSSAANAHTGLSSLHLKARSQPIQEDPPSLVENAAGLGRYLGKRGAPARRGELLAIRGFVLMP